MNPTVPLQVLIVDDEPAIRALLRTTLEAEGHGVVEAGTAREGATLAANRRIDLFLIDLGLPDGDGVALIREIRGWTQRPILVLSARTQENQKVDALDAGADDFVSKPFGVAELHARIRVALRHAGAPLAAGQALSLGDVTIDLLARSVGNKLGEQLGVQVVVDRKSALYLEGLTVDWFESLEKRGFKFENPNAQDHCGCGESFNIREASA